jgi:N-ethylmaleimide reductase
MDEIQRRLYDDQRDNQFAGHLHNYYKSVVECIRDADPVSNKSIHPETTTMAKVGLLSPYKFGSIELRNRIVMAPMTRSRAIGNIPNALMVEFYAQRSAAGLIITEGTSPSPNGLGYSRIPGIFSEAQVEGWKKVTQAVHSKGGKIFLQIMHTGRISHAANMSRDAEIIAPSAVKPAGQMWTDSIGMQEYATPKAMSIEDIEHTKHEYVVAAENAMKAGFDGIELHGANGYLLEQFISPASNKRTDTYGGRIENRCRFPPEVAAEAAKAIGKEKVGIRLSPFGVAGDMPHYPEIDSTYRYLSEQLNRMKILYVHLVDHSGMGAPVVPTEIQMAIHSRFQGTVILSGGYTQESAEAELQRGVASLIAFGRPFINNPDLVERFVHGFPLSTELDSSTFYSPGEKGYTDYYICAL